MQSAVRPHPLQTHAATVQSYAVGQPSQMRLCDWTRLNLWLSLLLAIGKGERDTYPSS